MQGNARGVCLECGWVRHFFLSLDGGCRETKWGRKINGRCAQCDGAVTSEQGTSWICCSTTNQRNQILQQNQ